jgi:hypothetical protein
MLLVRGDLLPVNFFFRAGWLTLPELFEWFRTGGSGERAPAPFGPRAIATRPPKKPGFRVAQVTAKLSGTSSRFAIQLAVGSPEVLELLVAPTDSKLGVEVLEGVPVIRGVQHDSDTAAAKALIGGTGFRRLIGSAIEKDLHLIARLLVHQLALSEQHHGVWV